VRFVGYGRAVVRGMKVDWDAEVTITAEVLRALHPHEPAHLRAGRLRRPFHVKPERAGTRGAPSVSEELLRGDGACGAIACLSHFRLLLALLDKTTATAALEGRPPCIRVEAMRMALAVALAARRSLS
jgi:hypothetical protein